MSSNLDRVGRRIGAVLLLTTLALPVAPALASGRPEHDGATQGRVHLDGKGHQGHSWLQARAVVVSASPDGHSGSVTIVGTNRPRLLSGGTTITVTLAVSATDVPTGTTAGAPAQTISSTTSVSGTDDVTSTTTVSTTTPGEEDSATEGAPAPRLLVAGQVVLLRGLYDPASLSLTQARIVHIWASAQGRGAPGHGQAKHNGKDNSPKGASHGQHKVHHGGKD